MKNIILVILLFTALNNLIFAQILTKIPSYTVSLENNGTSNVLFEYNYNTELWEEVGATGRNSIEAIAINDDIIYAVDRDTFGTLNKNTGIFTTIGSIGKANGSYGEIELDDIKGLTFDYFNKILYATHRIEGNGPNTNDLLFQIDISTGKVVTGAMSDANNMPVDYAIIEETFDQTLFNTGNNGIVYDVADIAYNNYTGEIYAIQNYGDYNTITTINSSDGTLVADIFDIDIDDVEGLAFSYIGELFATTGNNSEIPNAYIYIDLQTPSASIINYIDPSGENADFKSLSFRIEQNDLALKMVPANQTSIESIYAGDDVTFLLTVYNQGDIDNDSILITDYIPPGLILNDPNWAPVAGTNTAEYIILEPIVSGDSATISISFTIDDFYLSNSISNAAEITASFNSRFADANGSRIFLPDLDSEPDASNNEINVIDNEINEGGPDVNEDEDDHDVAFITLQQFDLALIMKLASDEQNIKYPGDDVTFTIEVTNQGTVTATEIKVLDYIPVEFFSLSTKNTNGWTKDDYGSVEATIPGILVPGESTNIDIVLEVETEFWGEAVNFAEIVSAKDTDGKTPPDIDSWYDTDKNNDAGGSPKTASDDSIMGDGTGLPGDSDAAYDEDDHDVALVAVELFDLALIVNSGSIQPCLGDDVIFTITVINQGTVDASKIRIIDYIPLGFRLSINDTNGWTGNAFGPVEITLPGILAPNEYTSIDIVLKAEEELQEDAVNIAEIISAEDINSKNPTDIDSTSDKVKDNDAGGNPESPSDDSTDGDGSGFPGDSNAATDEDDHDVAIVKVYNFTYQTNYSECVNLLLFNNQNILENGHTIIYNYSDCTDGNDNFMNCDPVIGFNNLAANEVLWATEKAYDYFLKKHNLNLDPVISYVNSNYKDNPNQAIYNKIDTAIYYGMGDGIKRTSMTTPDIIGHEITHHVIQSVNEMAKNYEYGALQESFADIFGEMIEYYSRGTNDWVFGSEAFIPNNENLIGVRSLKNPLDTGDPIFYQGENWVIETDVCNFDDLCGVHTNNGVQNYWFYLLSEGGSGINEDGIVYNIEGIGKEKASQIAFRNLETISTKDTRIKPYRKAMHGAIGAAQSLYGKTSNEAVQTIKAAAAVGFKTNPIYWKIANEQPRGEQTSLDTIPMSFDLVIDSLGEPLTADSLIIKMDIPEDLIIEDIIALGALQQEEVNTFLSEGEAKISIKRLSNQAQSIPSGSQVLRVFICIVTIDVGGEEINFEIGISGGTNSNTYIPFEANYIPLGIGEDINGGEEINLINMSLGIYQRNCNALGSIDIDVLNGIPPYRYSIKRNGIIIIDVTEDERKFQFNNLEEGNYELKIVDDNNRSITKNFTIWHQASIYGNECCPQNLFMPNGEFIGLFEAEKSINFGNGTLIKEGEFNICND